MYKKFKFPLLISGIVFVVCTCFAIGADVLKLENETLFMVVGIIGGISFTSMVVCALFYLVFKLAGVSEKTTNVKFEQVKHIGYTTLENNFDGVINNPTWDDVSGYINKMFDNSQEFITLTLAEAVYSIRFMQAARIEDGISLQLGIEENGATRIVEKICDREQTVAYMDIFFQYGNVEDVAEFLPLEFYEV